MSDIWQPPGWYGKLPGTGDFASRRLGPEVIRWWASWLQCSLQYQHERQVDWQQRYVRAPLWNFMIFCPSAEEVPRLQLGCLAPSCDRVGRYYPLCLLLPAVGESIDEGTLIEEACRNLTGIGYHVLDGIRRGLSPENFDHSLRTPPAPALAIEAHAWPELAHYLRGGVMASYWWTHPASGGAMRRQVHHGALNNRLFQQLFDGHNLDV